MTVQFDPQHIDGVIAPAIAAGQEALSEYEAKRLLAGCGLPVIEERLAADAFAAVAAAQAIGFPVALKACGPSLTHKTERGLIRLGLRDAAAVAAAVAALEEALAGEAVDGFLVQRMAAGRREIIAGGMRDPSFGPCVMLGVGGIAVEALGDVSFRLAPLEMRDALEMVHELAAQDLFGPFRGEPAVDLDVLCDVLIGVGRLLCEEPRIAQIDVNPLVVEGARPVAVDALITLDADPASLAAPLALAPAEAFEALFAPRAVAIVGVSDSPLKWGFRILFNTLEGDFQGDVYGVNPKYQELLGVPCFPSIDALPDNVDLALIVVPPPAVAESVRACADRGIRAVLIITAGFGELDDAAAHAAQEEVVRIARETDTLVVGPNCAGLASPAPKRLYSGMIGRYPEAGGLSMVSQSGNVGNTLLDWSGLHQIGIGRFVSTGNEAVLRTEDYLGFLAQDGQTESIMAYIEGTRDGRRLFETLRRTVAEKPVTVMKGGRTDAGMKAARSHTGALAGASRIFAAACRQAGAIYAEDTYDAIEIAGACRRQPLPRGRRVVVVSQGGGWGVIATDACIEAGLDVIPLPAETKEALDKILPKWWSQSNPVDLVAGLRLGALSQTVETVIKHPGVDAVILLGVGYIAGAHSRYQHSERAHALGLDTLAGMGAAAEIEEIRRIVDCIDTYGKPILAASDAVLQAYGPDPNAAIHEMERLGVYCFSSPAHVARALAHLCERFEFLEGIPRR